MDSGVSMLNLSLLLASTFDEAWGLETGDCKTRDFTFSTVSIAFFDRRGWIQSTRAGLFEGPCIRIESEGI